MVPFLVSPSSHLTTSQAIFLNHLNHSALVISEEICVLVLFTRNIRNHRESPLCEESFDPLLVYPEQESPTSITPICQFLAASRFPAHLQELLVKLEEDTAPGIPVVASAAADMILPASPHLERTGRLFHADRAAGAGRPACHEIRVQERISVHGTLTSMKERRGHTRRPAFFPVQYRLR